MVGPESVPAVELHRYLGAHPKADGSTRFCVWSPNAEQVRVHLVDSTRVITMRRGNGGYHLAEAHEVGVGDRYLIQVGNGPPLPDPASRFQPEGVHGPSAVVNSERYGWRDQKWCGRDPEELIIYELHLGAFTSAGTYRAAIDRLDELVELGVTAIELMPLADAPGRWNWGYDGVCLFAPNRNYGTPDELRRLVDEAHARNLAVILDVVYNHLGPEGNYLAQFGPYLSSRHSTVWGAAPNFDDPQHAGPVRRFFVANAIHWLEEYHIDALRVDAIHCMLDDSEPHIAEQMSAAVKLWSTETKREGLLIAESNVYDPEMTVPIDQGGIGFDAQWCDDLLHSVFACVRPGEQLCHRTYKPLADLDQTLQTGCVYQGTIRSGWDRRIPTQRVDTSPLVYSIQTHDFVGNHPLGKRLHQLTSPETQQAAAALLLLSPAIPMLFMGEEFACAHPFRFFVDFEDEQVRHAVVEGRRREYPQHDWSRGILPTDPLAFEDSKIGPAEQGDQRMRQWYRSLIALRKQWRCAGLLSDTTLSVKNDVDLGLFQMEYTNGDQAAFVIARLVDKPARAGLCPIETSGALILDSRPGQTEVASLLPNHAKVFDGSKRLLDGSMD